MSGAKQVELRIQCLPYRCFTCLALESVYLGLWAVHQKSTGAKKDQLWKHIFWFSCTQKECSLHVVTALRHELKCCECAPLKNGLSHKTNTDEWQSVVVFSTYEDKITEVSQNCVETWFSRFVMFLGKKKYKGRFIPYMVTELIWFL